jgi:hypothetical protein
MLPVDIRGLAGTVTLGGANTTEETCGGVRTATTADCVQTRRTFAKARMHAASPRPGVVVMGAITHVRLASAVCPAEPPDVRRRPLGPPLKLVRLPREALLGGRLARINLHASRSQRVNYASPAVGRLDESTDWTLKLVRVQG